MIAGFFAALIGNEILSVVSYEWAGRPAGIVLAYSALLWTTVASVLSGNTRLAALTYALMLVALISYSIRTYLKPSRIGLGPSAYNYLLPASLASSIGLAAAALALGGDVAVAMLYFPISVIFAVMSRDLPLVTGTRPGGWALNALAFALITAASSSWTFGVAAAAGFLLIASWVAALMASGLMRVAKKQRLFSYVKIHVAYLWLAAGGVLLLASPGGLWRDVAIHALSLGFIFNIVFGVDVILLDMLMSQTPRRVVV